MLDVYLKFVNEEYSMDTAKKLQDIIEIRGNDILADYLIKKEKEFMPSEKFAPKNIDLFSSYNKNKLDSFTIFEAIKTKIMKDETITIPKIVLLLEEYLKSLLKFKMEKEKEYLLLDTYKKIGVNIWNSLNDEQINSIVETIYLIMTKNDAAKKEIKLYNRIVGIYDDLIIPKDQLSLDIVENKYIADNIIEITNVKEFVRVNKFFESEPDAFETTIGLTSGEVLINEKKQKKALKQDKAVYLSNQKGIIKNIESVQQKHASGLTKEMIKYMDKYYRYNKKKV